jgi:ferredoxin-type protein NapH
VVLFPLLILDEFGMGQTWFCKWICPAGTLEAGLPLAALNQDIRAQLGFLFSWKMAILILILVWMVFSKRPFCRTLCPLGAIFGLFNRVSLLRMAVDEGKCVRCDQCYHDCPVDLRIYQKTNSPECVRCLKCFRSCKYGAVEYEFLKKRPAPLRQPGV